MKHGWKSSENLEMAQHQNKGKLGLVGKVLLINSTIDLNVIS